MELTRIEESILLAGMLALLITLLVQILYLTPLSRTIQAIRPEFRHIGPGKAWLGLIPLFHLVWPFIINRKVCDSIKADLEDRGMTENGDYGKTMATLYPAFRICGNIPGIGPFLSLAYLVLFIMWWVKLARYKKLLAPGEPYNNDLLDN